MLQTMATTSLWDQSPQLQPKEELKDLIINVNLLVFTVSPANLGQFERDDTLLVLTVANSIICH